jgi:putative endonuclease
MYRAGVALPRSTAQAAMGSPPLGRYTSRMAESHEFGRSAEALAAAALVRRGWCILNRNWRAGHRELDIVARKGRTVAFVEVKARGSPGFGHPLLAINRAKRRELRAAAAAWVAEFGRAGDEYRFDAIAVRPGPEPGTVVVEHLPDAWRHR